MRALIVVAALGAACAPQRDVVDLDHAPAADLGGGASPRAWRIVFVGDGYSSDELADYRARVDGYVAALRAHDDGFVALDPSAFHFYRVDVSGDGWYLGTTLDRSDSCAKPFLRADPDLVGRAARNALADPDVIVVLAHDVDGRANGGVHMSDRESWHVLEHELSHALFHLGDEYSEFTWCSNRAPTEEATLLATANVTLLDDPAKWADATDEVSAGGGRWPCAHHPTSSCTMLDPSTGHYCPVCTDAIRETIAARMCGDDSRAPRVAFVGPQPSSIHVARSGQKLALEAAAFDESAVTRVRFALDDATFFESEWPWAELPLDGVAPGRHSLTVDAIDAEGQIGSSAPWPIDVVQDGVLAPSVTELTATASPDGWARVSAHATPLGGTLALTLGPSTVVMPVDAANVAVSIPADASGTLTAVARTAAGVASAPAHLVIDVPVATSDAPVVESVSVNGLPFDSFVATGPMVDVDIQVHSCSPLDRLEITEGGALIATAAPAPEDACVHSIHAALSPQAGAITITAFDHLGRSGSLVLKGRTVLDPLSCGIDARADTPVAALSRPVELALGHVGAAIVSSRVAVDNVPALTFAMTRADGTPGALLAARDVPGPPRDGTAVALHVTVVAQCTGLVAATTVVPITVDAIAPTLHVSRFTRIGEPLTALATDASGPVTLEGTGPVTAGDTAARVVRAIDAAGNTTQRTIVPVAFPHDRAGCPP